MFRRACALLLAFLALPVFPQFTETIEVRVINVDVIVTGRDGRPVPGLTKEDFELYEDGKLQPITNFLEMRGEEPKATKPAPAQPAAPQAEERPADIRARHVVIFLDTTSIHPFTRDRVFKPLETFLQRTMRAGDHVMLISWNPGLKVELPFTNDTGEAAKTLQRLVATTTTATSTERDFKLAQYQIRSIPADYALRGEMPTIADAISAAQMYATKVSYEQAQRVEAIKSVIASLRGIGGRNALVLFTNSLSENPALPIFYFIDSLKEKFSGGASFVPHTEANRFQNPNLVREISELANSSGITMYPIAAAGLGVEFDSLGADSTGSEYGSTTRGLTHPDEGMQALHQIAEATGGKALTSSNNFDLAFNTLTQDMTSYYSLGYRTEGQRTDVVRSISVKLRKKGYNVRARQTFVEKSLTSEMNDAVAANLLYPIAKNDLSVSIDSGGALAGSPEQPVVPVVIRIPTTSLTLIPDGTDLVGQFSSYTAFLRRDGRVSEVKRSQHLLRFPADSLKRRKEITVKYDLTVDDKTESVSVGIMDDTSHATGFVTMPLTGKPAT